MPLAHCGAPSTRKIQDMQMQILVKVAPAVLLFWMEHKCSPLCNTRQIMTADQQNGQLALIPEKPYSEQDQMLAVATGFIWRRITILELVNPCISMHLK